MLLPDRFFCVNPKTMDTRIISGMLLCCMEKGNQMQDENTTSCNGSYSRTSANGLLP